ncbi:MAG: alpha-L-fucosidase [Mucilaginibacter polytrichastri]|nr:alpha-L-fucosidase [Mucilaginibacter polytrichastri]
MKQRFTRGALVALALTTLSSCLENNIHKPKPFGAVPDARQIAWHEMEQNAFIHFTVNTFTGREWGEGGESEELFDPSGLDVNQWVKVLKDAGFKGVILTCKHHDGFCLWPSKYTEHSIRNSPYKGGKGDIVRELSDAAAKEGLKFGVYLSPWDRNAASYGKPEYIDLYRKQMTELLSNYGKVFEFWMDGANGGDGYYGGANETRKIDRKTYYQWPQTLDSARKLQPQVVFFSDAGPDIRWCGNESGTAGDPNWAMMTRDTLYPGAANINDILQHGQENGKQWVPAEVDVSIRPGWFFHEKENAQVRTPENLFDLYLSSVGRGSNLLLNIPPDKRGRFHEADVKALMGFKKLRDAAFKTDLALQKDVRGEPYRAKALFFAGNATTDGDKDSYWTTDDDVTSGSLTVDLEGKHTVKYVCIQEYIKLGQRIKRFTVEVADGENWKKVGEGTTVGYKRILKIDPVQTDKVRITVNDALACPVIHTISVY